MCRKGACGRRWGWRIRWQEYISGGFLVEAGRRVSGNGVLPARDPDYIHFRGLSGAPLGEGRFVRRLPYFKGALLKSGVYQRANYALYRLGMAILGHGRARWQMSPGPFRFCYGLSLLLHSISSFSLSPSPSLSLASFFLYPLPSTLLFSFTSNVSRPFYFTSRQSFSAARFLTRESINPVHAYAFECWTI